MQHKRVCIFVDGENLRHSIRDLFKTEFNPTDYLPKKADWGGFFDDLSRKAVGGPDFERIRAYWYLVQHLDFFPYKLPDADREGLKLTRLLEKHEPYKIELRQLAEPDRTNRMKDIAAELKRQHQTMRRRFDGWSRIQTEIATRHRGVEFRPAGAITYNLFTRQLGQEKAVDVKLATDLLILRDIYDVAVIVSGDQDYVPAVQVVKDSGKCVVNVSFETRGGRQLPGGAWRLNQRVDFGINIPYGELKSHLNI